MADKFQESTRPADTAPATHGNAGPGQSVRYGGVILSRRKWPTRSISKSSPHFESQSPGANGTGLQRAQECWLHGLVVRESLGVFAQGSLLRPSPSAAGRDVLSWRHQTSAGPLACYWRRVRNSGKRRLLSVNRRFPVTRLFFFRPAGVDWKAGKDEREKNKPGIL